MDDRTRRSAQDLVYDAWEAATAEREEELMRKALEVDPENVDALLYMLDRARLKGNAKIDDLRNIVTAGERQLGSEAFKKFAGGFWGWIESRPYMRARHALAVHLLAEARTDEAIGEYEGLLALNPNDNQGARYDLLAAYLIRNRLEGAQKLFSRYKECRFNAVFAWCRVLERWLRNRVPAAKRALATARKQNPYMQAYIEGRRPIPRTLPEAYSPGTVLEAVCFGELLRTTWAHYPEALRWLAAQERG